MEGRESAVPGLFFVRAERTEIARHRSGSVAARECRCIRRHMKTDRGRQRRPAMLEMWSRRSRRSRWSRRAKRPTSQEGGNGSPEWMMMT